MVLVAEKMVIEYGDTIHNCYYRGNNQWYIITMVNDRIDSEMNVAGLFANDRLHDMLNSGIRHTLKVGV